MGIGDSVTLGDLETDPDPILARMRAEEPVCFVPSLDMWLVTKWDDLMHMEDHPEVFTANTEPSFLARALGPNMLTKDRPEASRTRDAMLPAFQAGGVAGRFASEHLVQMADRLIDGFVEDGEGDLMASYAGPLSAGSLAAVLGLDSHGWEQVWQWCEGLCADIANFENDPELTALGDRARETLGQAIDRRIDEITEGDGGVSAIAHFIAAETAGGPLDRSEIVNNVRLMISGGINEPRDGIGLVVGTVLADQHLLDELVVEPSLWRKCVEEVFRLHSPVGTITRQATCDTTLRGKAIPAGSLIAGVIRSANLDEERWSDPRKFDLHRSEGGHAAFATGEHRCLGEWLGRQVVRVGSQRLMDRLTNLGLQSDRPITLQGFEFRGPAELPCRWDRP
ncbi:MAG: cytochrome P450 [Actinomycetota bacterium]|nr:cytochrome P450 [Actinomycetota bacterium]MED6328000.1 cytochrome P450 [Actinomycetota bacterium]